MPGAAEPLVRPQGRFAFVDALRGIASLGVVMFHAAEGRHITGILGLLPAWVAIGNGRRPLRTMPGTVRRDHGRGLLHGTKAGQEHVVLRVLLRRRKIKRCKAQLVALG